MNFKIGREVTITGQDIDDIVTAAFEGGINYWASKAVVVGEYLGEFASEQISRGGKIEIYLDEPFDDKDTEMYILDRENFLNGFKLWLDEGFDFYNAVSGGKVDTCDIDADAADSIIQCALFGELVYG